MDDIFKSQDRGPMMMGAVVETGYDETVWDSWEIIGCFDNRSTPDAETQRFPVELRVQPGLDNATVQGALGELLQSQEPLAARHIGFSRVASPEGEKWQLVTSAESRFPLVADGGSSLISVSLAPKVPFENREIAIRELIGALHPWP